jgi:hypothetical protein
MDPFYTKKYYIKLIEAICDSGASASFAVIFIRIMLTYFFHAAICATLENCVGFLADEFNDIAHTRAFIALYYLRHQRCWIFAGSNNSGLFATLIAGITHPFAIW